MKIAHIIQFLSPGGLENLVIELSKEQIKKGHEVSIIYYEGQGEWIEKLSNTKINPLPIMKKKNGFDFGVCKHLKSKLDDFDVIHTHDISPLFYLFFAHMLNLFCAKKTYRMIHTIHGLSQIQNNFKYLLYEFFLLQLPHKIVFVGDVVNSYYDNKFRFLSDKFVKIKNGIPISDRKDYSQQINEFKHHHQINSDEKLYLSLARIVPIKNQKELISRFDLTQARLVIVGPIGDQEYFESLPKNEKVIYCGPTNTPDFYYQLCDYFISLSQSEGLPLTVLEAMSHKKLCILSDIPGHQIANQLSESEETTHPYCLYVDIFQTRPLAETLKQSNNETEMIQAAKEMVDKNFSITKTSEKYLEVYGLSKIIE